MISDTGLFQGWGVLAVGVVAGYLLLVAVLYILQRRMIYVPDRRLPDPGRSELPDARVMETTTADGLRLRFWYVAAKTGFPTVVLFHGNAGNIKLWAVRGRQLADAGLGVVLAEYRGYGGNPGRPTEQGLYADARATLDAVGEVGVPTSRVVLLGESLGSGVATQMACEARGALLALVAPMTSIADVAAHHLPWLPTRRLVKDRFDSAAKIPRLQVPVLIFHGALDGTIPMEQGMELFHLAPQPKALHAHPEADHVDLWDFHLVEDLLEFLTAQRIVDLPAEDKAHRKN